MSENEPTGPSVNAVIGRRVQLVLGNPDPGYPTFVEYPREPLVGTIIKEFIGIHHRPSYYVQLDEKLQLEITNPDPPFPEGHVRVLREPGRNLPWRRRYRVSNIVSICDADDRTHPPADLLAQALLTSGRGRAGLTRLVLDGTLPNEFHLEKAQRDQRKPLTRRHDVSLGYADVEVVELDR